MAHLSKFGRTARITDFFSAVSAPAMAFVKRGCPVVAKKYPQVRGLKTVSRKFLFDVEHQRVPNLFGPKIRMYVEPGKLTLIARALVPASPKTCPADDPVATLRYEQPVRFCSRGACVTREGKLRKKPSPSLRPC